jgi:hypothetical protein
MTRSGAVDLDLKPGSDQEPGYCHAQSIKSFLEVLSARRPAGITS